MLISEIYQSRQGEGLWAGTESIFIRTSGCNLRCWFCDTPFTSWAPEGTTQSIEQILTAVGAHSATHVVLTGGEPLLWSDVTVLTAELHQQGKTITIETAGTVIRDVHCDLMSISPKLSNSTPDPTSTGTWSARHEATRWRPEVIRQLMAHHPYQLKFVVDVPEDLDEIAAAVATFIPLDTRRVLLMPQGTEPDELQAKESWLQPLAKQYGFTYCPRQHIFWYGHARGT